MLHILTEALYGFTKKDRMESRKKNSFRYLYCYEMWWYLIAEPHNIIFKSDFSALYLVHLFSHESTVLIKSRVSEGRLNL